MGDQGPCGPCSEIHFDRIGGRNAASLVNKDDPDVLEIWNLVFIQYNREGDGMLRLLPNKHVDTGMGLERIVSVLQKKTSNYDTDLFNPIFSQIQKLTGARPYSGKVGIHDVDGVDMAYRVVADHARTLLFAISDGGVPSNEGRGYVLRRILRRGCRYARRKFGVNLGEFFPSLLDIVAETMKKSYPEVTLRLAEAKAILKDEERSFARTLDRGEYLFESILPSAQKEGFVTGADAWKLYDTFGFPLDLTRLMAQERGLDVNMVEFKEAETKAKDASRKSREGSSSISSGMVLDVHDIALLEKSGIPKTNDAEKYSVEATRASVRGIFHNHKLLPSFSADQANTPIGIILDKTNFYAESGGQKSDQGRLIATDGTEFVVKSVMQYGGHVLHLGFLASGIVKMGQEFNAAFDGNRRAQLMLNHTATHILNLGLRKILTSDTVDQKGSLVDPGKLRFDFTMQGTLKLGKC
ncbi:Alanine--tRNA ligase [Entomophthora muscae]|uniref:Alanine--tRNA ligase n=1 Tax=Entomophthora muscae TaxID=34485 RepID=A0ACC2RFP0_9FUNG|nr:Alanine--tRNA ligase [Entomophthora muscae]